MKWEMVYRSKGQPEVNYSSAIVLIYSCPATELHFYAYTKTKFNHNIYKR